MTIQTQDFVTAIALEAQALEDLFSKEIHNYHNSGALLGKSWYAIGLESNDSDTSKDNANKQSIIRRMIDAVVNFVNRIVERIKAFFAKTDSAKNKEVADLENKKIQEIDSIRQIINKSDAAMREEVRKQTVEKIAEYIEQHFNPVRLKVVCEILGEDFFAFYDQALDICYGLTNGIPPAKNLAKVENEIYLLNSRIESCKKALADAENKSDREVRHILRQYVAGGTMYNKHASGYARHDLFLDLVTSGLQSIKSESLRLNDQHTEEALEILKVTNKVIASVASFIALSGTVAHDVKMLAFFKFERINKLNAFDQVK